MRTSPNSHQLRIQFNDLSVIFTINPIKQLRLLKNELSLEVSEMTAPTSNEPPLANELQENSTNQNRFKNDRSSTDQNS